MENEANKPENTEVDNLIINSVLGFIPGGHIIQNLAEYRGKVQQERLNKFTTFLKEGAEKYSGRILTLDNLQNEDFIDVLEKILNKVTQTQSEKKLKRYRNVLLRVMYNKDETEMLHKYISLIEEINDTQILILSCFRENLNREADIITDLIKVAPLQKVSLAALEYQDIRLASGQIVKKSEFDYYLIDLQSKGIISSNFFEPGQPKQHSLTVIGKSFLRFISEYKSE